MPKAKQLDGLQFGRLTAVKYLYSQHYGTKGKSHRMYLCECDCGNTKVVSGYDLVRGHAKSCGCLQKEVYVDLHNNPRRFTHGMSKTRLYQCYVRMIRRCTHEKNWKDKGITVDEQWLADPQCFFDWALANGYDDTLTLDRIDVYGNYCPDNCRWATASQQANNKTNSRYITIGGITHTLAEWSKVCGVPAPTIAKRIEHDYSEEEWLVPVGALYHTDTNKKNRGSYFHYLTVNGETHTITEWSNITGLSRSCIQSRIKSGWSEEDLLLPIGEKSHSKFWRSERSETT